MCVTQMLKTLFYTNLVYLFVSKVTNNQFTHRNDEDNQ